MLVWPTICLTIYFVPLSLEEILVARFEIVCKTHDLKTVAITDGPNLQITPVVVVKTSIRFVKARVPSHPVDG